MLRPDGCWQLYQLLRQKVKESNSLKILGTTYNKMGRSTTHCKEIAARAMSRVNLLRRLRDRSWGTNGQRLLMFYKQFVRPVMENGYAYTATAKRTALKPIQVVQNSALRIILKADRKTRIQDLERRTGIPPSQQRLQQLKDGAAARYANSPLLARLHTRKNLSKHCKRNRSNIADENPAKQLRKK